MPYSVIRKKPSDFRKSALELFLFLCTDFLDFEGYTSEQQVHMSSWAGFVYISSHPLHLPFSYSRNVWDVDTHIET